MSKTEYNVEALTKQALRETIDALHGKGNNTMTCDVCGKMIDGDAASVVEDSAPRCEDCAG